MSVKHRGKLVLLMGPSGVGKSVVLKELRKRRPSTSSGQVPLHFPRSATTRPRRPGERNDLYVFVTDEEFDALIAHGRLLEWARVHDGARYGTLIEEIVPPIEEGKVVVREVDVQGFESIRKHPLFSCHAERSPERVPRMRNESKDKTKHTYRLQSIFLLPESTEQLIAHIAKRAPMGEEELRRRLESMRKEMAYAELADVKVVSREGKLAEVVREMERLIAA